MEQTSRIDRIHRLSEGEPAPTDSEYWLNVVLVFDDFMARRWAEQAFARVQWASRVQIRTSEWRIRSLLDEHDFPEAVGAAARADVIVVALHAVEELPIPLCVWATAWLPRRLQRPGALLAWVGRPDQPGTGSSGVQQYLRAVARKAGLDFLPGQTRSASGLPRAEGRNVLFDAQGERGLLSSSSSCGEERGAPRSQQVCAT